MLGFISILLLPVLWLFKQLMALPGTEVNDIDSPPPRSAPTDTGVGFMVGLAERGPLTPWLIRSLGEFTSKFGDRVAYSLLYDAVETFFKEGGAELYVQRYTGPAPTTGSHDLLDGGGAVSIHVTAASPGDWSSRVSLTVNTNAQDATIPAGSFVVIVELDGEVVVESPVLADQNAAVAWAQANAADWVVLTLGASANDPAHVSEVALSAGSDDHAAATDADREAALAKLTKDLGPGQVSVPGATTNAIQVALLAHGDAMGRVPVLDGIDTAVSATLIAQAAALRGSVGDRYSGLFAPWDTVPGIMKGTTRTVPPSARVMGNMARNDGLGLSPNTPAAGDKGQAQFTTGLSQAAWNDTDREALNDAGVNVSRVVYGGVRTYGYRTLADPTTEPNYIFLSNSRLRSAIKARLDAVAESFEFSEIDGFGRNIQRFVGQCIGVLSPFWAEGSLYGATQQEAFNVDGGAQVNTPQTIANGEMHAQCAVKMSPFAERVIIDVAKVGITEAVA
jgi:uncharacterized protein